jgi:hypothetical protein
VIEIATGILILTIIHIHEVVLPVDVVGHLIQKEDRGILIVNPSIWFVEFQPTSLFITPLFTSVLLLRIVSPFFRDSHILVV